MTNLCREVQKGSLFFHPRCQYHTAKRIMSISDNLTFLLIHSQCLNSVSNAAHDFVHQPKLPFCFHISPTSTPMSCLKAPSDLPDFAAVNISKALRGTVNFPAAACSCNPSETYCCCKR